MHKGNFDKSGAEIVWGDGHFIGPKTIEVTDTEGGKRHLEGDVVVVCTGSRAVISDVSRVE